MVINYKVDPSKVSILSSVVHCGIAMNKRWLYGLYICLSKELSISGSGSLYIINLRSASATTAFSPQQPRLSHHHNISAREQHQANKESFIFKNIQSSPPCRKVDLDSSVKVSQDLQIIHLINS